MRTRGDAVACGPPRSLHQPPLRSQQVYQHCFPGACICHEVDSGAVSAIVGFLGKLQGASVLRFLADSTSGLISP